jgi:ADP-ribose pyrophosphatase
MESNLPQGEIVLDTKWFQIVARKVPGYVGPHYSLQTLDYVCIVAVNEKGELLLVRQFRPAVNGVTLEIPSGHVEAGQTPEEAARQELFEETGYEAGEMHFLTNLVPDTGRLSNRLWCYFAAEVKAAPASRGHIRESGLELVHFRDSVQNLVQRQDFCSALHCAALFAAVLQGRIRA